jgi:S1-C subfamily serine protease
MGSPTASLAAGSTGAAAGTAPATTATATTPTTSSSDGAAINATIQHAYAVASPSVVYVASQGVGTGSGVIYDRAGDIVTNNHVISGASSIRVTLSNGTIYPAQVVGTDAADDLAVIKINAPNLIPAHFSSIVGHRVAETVLVIGSPLGLQNSVTSGLISGVNRVEQEPNGSYIPNAIQTSAPINPGNSGGALVGLKGYVLGIPTLVQTSAGNGVPAQDVGFAIPSDRVTPVAKQIIATGKVENTGRAYLGVSVTDSTVQGALIVHVGAGSPAATAGLQAGDVITTFACRPISGQVGLLTVLAQAKPDQTVAVQVNRNGSTMSLSVQLGQLPANP